MTKADILEKLDDILDRADNDRLNELLGRKKKKAQCNPIVVILAIIAGIALICGIAYAVYNFFAPDDFDDLDDEYDDDFEEDFFEDEEEDTQE